MKKQIVKIQVSLFDSSGKGSVLVYNKDQTVMQEFPLTKEILEQMGDEPKKYFYATIPPPPSYITVHKEAPWQDW